jgi:pyocin large subunit-like protein
MFPKKGKIFPGKCSAASAEINFAEAIAKALRNELGDTHQAVKTLMRWTGANERTVKNWLAGTHGPRGEHLLTLVRNSDAVLEAFLRLAGRERVIASGKLAEARTRLDELVGFLDQLLN